MPDFLSEDEAKNARNFHTTVKGYKATPLVNLDNLAKELGVSKIYVKDESYRFGLNAFKGLGVTYAIANPIGNDEKIVSSESGAVGLGLVSLLLEREELKELKNKLELNKDSVILCISTEGDTDPEHYRKVVYDGKNQSTFD